MLDADPTDVEFEVNLVELDPEDVAEGECNGSTVNSSALAFWLLTTGDGTRVMVDRDGEGVREVVVVIVRPSAVSVMVDG